MADYDNTNTGALFKNDKKVSEKHPDYKGTANVDGTEYWVSAWIKTSKSGQSFMSFAYTPKQQEVKPKQDIMGLEENGLMSDIPF